jgi:hypothetical protein
MRRRTPRHLTRLLGTTSTAALCFACAACGGLDVNDGPLAGSRAEPGSTELCTPLYGATTVYVGEQLQNTSSEPVLVESARIVDATNLDAERSSVLIDLVGPAVDDFVGNFVWPDRHAQAQREAQARIERSLAPTDVIIDAGASAQLLIAITPERVSAPATVTRVVVRYLAGDEEHEEVDTVRYVVVASAC